jgi:hypothetical protein
MAGSNLCKHLRSHPGSTVQLVLESLMHRMATSIVRPTAGLCLARKHSIHLLIAVGGYGPISGPEEPPRGNGPKLAEEQRRDD